MIHKSSEKHFGDARHQNSLQTTMGRTANADNRMQALISICETVVWGANANIDKMHTLPQPDICQTFECCTRWMNALGMKTYIHCSCSTHALWRRHRSFEYNCELKKQMEFRKDRQKPTEFIEIACRAFYACTVESAQQSINIRLKTHINTVGVNWTKKMEDLRHLLWALSHVVIVLSSFFISFFAYSQW